MRIKKLYIILLAAMLVCGMSFAGTGLAAEADPAEAASVEELYADALFLTLETPGTGDAAALTVLLAGEVIPENRYSEFGISFDGSVLTLETGIFVLSGTLQGQVQVKAGKKNETTLVLNGLQVSNAADAALLCARTGMLILTLAEGSENVLCSGTETEINEESFKLAADASGGALLLKSDAQITGTGALKIQGFINNGIHCTKSLTIDDGSLDIAALNNGIKVKNDFIFNGGTVSLWAGGDGIKAESEGEAAQDEVVDEETGEVLSEAKEAKEDTGTICINGGALEINSYDDGMQALLDLQITGGKVVIAAYGTYNTKGSYSKTKDETFSGKGLKSGGPITISGGEIELRTYNDAVHSAGLLNISGGSVYVYSGDDGLHSDVEIRIDGGDINIENAYEGVEANQITVNDGTISLFAWDDGFNANGGRGGFGPGSGGQKANTPTETPNLIFNGGYVYVNANGDGVDSNGNILMTGGTLVVDGPTSNWNGPIDAGTENGGTIIITGGTAFAGGASGMAESFNSKSEQVSFIALLSTSYKKGSEIRILDPEGRELFAHTAASGGNSIVFSCAELESGQTYVLEIDGEPYDVPLTGISTRVNARRQK